MNPKKLHGCAVALALTFATIATGAPPLALDSKAKSTAAVLAALHLKTLPLDELDSFTQLVRSPIEEALQQLSAATTPAAVINSRDGVSVACAAGGVLNARLSRAFPRTLKLDWIGCKFTDRNFESRELDGSAEVVLLTESFSPERIGAIRLGTRTSDLVDKLHRQMSPTATLDDTRSSNLRMTGAIPMKRASTYGPVVGEYAYELTGFILSHQQLNEEYFVLKQDVRRTVEHLVTSGNLWFDEARTTQFEDARYYFGRVGFVNSTEGNPDFSSSYRFEGFRLQREQDLYHQVSTQRLDGRIELTYPNSDPVYSGCQSGSYVFKTLAPIVVSAAPPNLFTEFETGDLLINGSTRVKFYTASTVPPELPVPVNHNLIHLEVRGVGTFDHDSNGSTELRNAVQCWY